MRGAGGGRPPNPSGKVRHRDPPYKAPITLDADDRPDVVPEPALPFSGVRRELWDAMWDRPIATLWDPADVAVLTRMVVLQTSPEVYSSRGLLQELRQLEDRFLLNPYARAMQRVVIHGADGGQENADAEVAWIDDARRRLREPS